MDDRDSRTRPQGGRANTPLPREAVTMMASREHRLHHWLWHEVRNKWHDYTREVQEEIRSLGWEPPRPANDPGGAPNVTNGSGEDFLYMHRQMIADVNTVLASVGDPSYPRVTGWSVPPPPDDPDFPVPPSWFSPETQEDLPFALLDGVKTDRFYRKRMLYWHGLFTNLTFLRGLALGVLGTLIEQTIHNAMHLRWSSNPVGVRPDPSPTDIHGTAIKPVWDDPRYDFLGDTYSSHVNPIFWKLHGWIDDRIEDWKIANGVFRDDFWKGTWVGPTPGEGTPDGPHHIGAEPTAGGVHVRLESPDVAAEHTAIAEQVVAVVSQTGVFNRGFVPPEPEDWLRAS